MNFIVNILTVLKMVLIKKLLWEPLIKKTRNPKKAQNDLLLKILKQNRDTQFGRDYKFSDISCYNDFMATVPINQYEALREYIEKQDAEKIPYLNTEQPIMYAQTSGSTGKPKYIPVLNSTISDYRNSQHIMAYSIYASIKGVYKGKILAVVSPATEGFTNEGTPYGSMSGLIYNSMPALMRSKYVIPAKIFEIEDYEKKYYEMTLHAMTEKNITMIATANPSTLVKIEQIMAQNIEQLLLDVAIKNNHRAQELKNIIANKGSLIFADIWPQLKAVVTWTGGSCGAQIPKLKNKFPEITRIVELGYLSSEFRGGLTLDAKQNKQIPALHENFYEFVEKDDWENNKHNFKTLEFLEKNKQYYIFATTQNGLYRYDINDLIQVTGKINETPTIEFVQKGKGVTNLTGEKLYENQVIQAMSSMFDSQGIELQFFIMLGCSEDLQYTLYIEHELINTFDIDQQLSNLNIEFEGKLLSGRLKPIKIKYIKADTGEVYKKHCINSGQREGQYKLSYLQYKHRCLFNFDEYLRE